MGPVMEVEHKTELAVLEIQLQASAMTMTFKASNQSRKYNLHYSNFSKVINMVLAHNLGSRSGSGSMTL